MRDTAQAAGRSALEEAEVQSPACRTAGCLIGSSDEDERLGIKKEEIRGAGAVTKFFCVWLDKLASARQLERKETAGSCAATKDHARLLGQCNPWSTSSLLGMDHVADAVAADADTLIVVTTIMVALSNTLLPTTDITRQSPPPPPSQGWARTACKVSRAVVAAPLPFPLPRVGSVTCSRQLCSLFSVRTIDGRCDGCTA